MICRNEGLEARHGRYQVKKSKKDEEVERRQSR